MRTAILRVLYHYPDISTFPLNERYFHIFISPIVPRRIPIITTCPLLLSSRINNEMISMAPNLFIQFTELSVFAQ